MDTILRTFTGDVHTKEAVKEFIIEVIKTEGLEKMFAKEDVSHVAEAYDLINKAFEQLDQTYGIKERPTTPTNQAK